MGVFNFDDEITSVVAPAILFKALVIDADTLTTKIIDDIKSVEIVEGNGGAGTIKKITFVEALFDSISRFESIRFSDLMFPISYSFLFVRLKRKGTGAGTKQSKRAAKDPNKPKRLPSAFFVFMLKIIRSTLFLLISV
ncbi:hypothetical protein RYX36_002240 [Vicia faba]